VEKPISETRPREAPAAVPPVPGQPPSEGAAEPGFQELFHRYFQPVHSFFRNQGFSRDDSFDLTQETFLRVYKSIGSFRHEATFKTWLFQIATNLWRNELRRRAAGKRDAQEVSLDGPAAPGDEEEMTAADLAPDAAPGPLQGVLAEERLKLLREALEELPPQMRRCVLLRVDRELKYREIADLLQLSIETVKSQIHQARERLKGRLGDAIDRCGL
jgi:RNA polymerase sigma-70 factor, ECF subfamily